MTREYNLPKLFAAADPLTVAKHIGLRVKRMGKRNSILCPAHEDRHFGSCFLTKTGFRCYACGKSGGLVDLVSLSCHIDKQQALDIIADACGNSVEFLKTTEEALQSRKANAENFVKVLPDDKLALIGLMPSDTPVKMYRGMIRFKEEADPSDWIEWFPDDSEEGWYGLKTEVLDASPLKTLARTDYEEYQTLICEKAQEAIESYQSMIQSALGHTENHLSPYIRTLAQKYGIASFLTACRQNIEEIQEIIIEHGGEINRKKHIFGKLPCSVTEV